MISVCVPVYRYRALPLARELVRQVQQLPAGEVELLIYDDASPDDGEWGREDLRELRGIRYVELSHNLGRAAIRNRMVNDATGEYCLLLDADAAVPPHFLMNYRNWLTARPEPTEPVVVVGGRRYTPEPPADPALQLHWWYGTCRESDAGRLADAGWLGFHSNNFLATRSLLMAHPFPEDATGYGHEDTLWGQQLTGTRTRLFRIDNAVTHLGLEPAEVFLHKQRQAIGNLRRLHQLAPHLRTRLIDLTRRYPRLDRWARYLPEAPLRRYLTSRPRPDLRVLDLLKLRWWNELEPA